MGARAQVKAYMYLHRTEFPNNFFRAARLQNEIAPDFLFDMKNGLKNAKKDRTTIRNATEQKKKLALSGRLKWFTGTFLKASHRPKKEKNEKKRVFSLRGSANVATLRISQVCGKLI